MSVSTKQWADMTADERRQYKATRQAAAFVSVESGELPTGIPGEVIGKLLSMAGKQGIARPTGETGTGGVSYSIPQGLEVVAGGKRFRFNRTSISILGSNTAGKPATLPEGVEEDLLTL